MAQVKREPFSNGASCTAHSDQLLMLLHALVIDIQATGQNPKTNVLLEIGWQSIDSSQKITKGKINTATFTLPNDYRIPERIARITGMSEGDFEHASDEKKIWQKLYRTARKIIAFNHSELCPVIIHYARFEKPYLTLLQQRYSPGIGFPFLIICTHDIVRRLLPSLPRRGLRATAGYFGFSTEQFRRSAHHIAATTFVWSKIVPLLADASITTLNELILWLSEKAPRNSGRAYPMDSTMRDSLPDAPGVYRMSRSNNDVLYVGKATSLKQRVNSYFRKKAGHAEHILEMLSQARKLSVAQFDTALEAALLESDEIKKLNPPYNISLQEKNRSVVFVTQNFEAHSVKPTKRYCIGPVISPNLFYSLSKMGHIFSSFFAGEKAIIEPCGAVLGISEIFAPSGTVLKQGLQLFFETYQEKMKREPLNKSLLRIGKQVWQDRIQEQVDESDEEEVKEEFVWTPEAVFRMLESIVSHAAHHIRRARWYCVLSESSLQWRMRGGIEAYKCLTLQNCTVHKREVIFNLKNLAIPPGYRKRAATRKRSFDVPSYDRMRILTTEIRRIVKEGRSIEVRLSPWASMSNVQLARLLQWV